jgi:hypothetical protein
MLKHLTIVALAGALLPACIITTGDTATDTFETSDNTTGGTTAGTGTTGGTTGGTTDDSDSATTVATESGTTESLPTTGEPTTGEPGTTTTEPGTSTTDGTTGGPTSPFGMCGWVADSNFYGCAADDGAEPGVEDPAGIDPIACDPALVEGAECNEKEGPVKNIGCCMPNGDLFLCDSQDGDPPYFIIKIACGE